MLVDEECHLAVGERSKSHAGGDPLSEGIVLRFGHALPQDGLTGGTSAEGLLVDAIGREQAQVLERLVGEQVRLVEDDDGAFG